jgi:hypothetical protein
MRLLSPHFGHTHALGQSWTSFRASSFLGKRQTSNFSLVGMRRCLHRQSDGDKALFAIVVMPISTILTIYSAQSRLTRLKTVRHAGFV